MAIVEKPYALSQQQQGRRQKLPRQATQGVKLDSGRVCHIPSHKSQPNKMK
jgi:hypothetical protein